MAPDWNSGDFLFLQNQLRAGKVCLFAGAGFSVNARNAHGQSLPLGGPLAKLLAEKAGLPFNGEALPAVYEAVEPTIGTKNLTSYLRELYAVQECDEWYKLAMSVCWYRVYTTNIDTLFQFLQPYSSGQKSELIVRGAIPAERDPHFERLQCVHLHGHVEQPDRGLSFSVADFAKHTVRLDPWYQQLVSDLYSNPVIFVGTQLEEPILSHYIELREFKPNDAPREYRPKSFLVCPNISEIRAATLKRRNIVPVDCTGQEFFESLAAGLDLTSLTVSAVQVHVWPHIFSGSRRVVSAVANDFDPIVPESLPIPRLGATSRFFLGAEATWEDIDNHRDANREITDTLLATLTEDSDAFRCFVLYGPAGSGKTTTLMRTATEVARQGHQVLFARGLERLSLDAMVELARTHNGTAQRLFVFVDVVSRHVGSFARWLETLKSLNRLTLLLSDRTNRYASKCQRLSVLEPIEVSMPDLTEPDVLQIIDRLKQFGFLGALKNKSHSQQVHEFMVRAKRQLLVALREATAGKDFDLILENEFDELSPEAKLAYVICCIAVSQGAPGVYAKHLMPCIPRSMFTKGVVLDDLLRGVIVPANETGTLLKPRHGLIATLVATSIAPQELKFDGIVAFLEQVSRYIEPANITRRTPPYLAYRGMVNSEGLYQLFGGDTKMVLEVYDRVRPHYEHDFLFWLQFGMAHIRAGNYDYAENFLNQSLNIAADKYDSHQTKHQLGILYLLQATSAANPIAMHQRAQQGIDILADQIKVRGSYDSYTYHAYVTHVGRWYAKLGKDNVSGREWEALRAVGREAREKYRLDENVTAAVKEMETLYLRRAIVNNGNSSQQ